MIFVKEVSRGNNLIDLDTTKNCQGEPRHGGPYRDEARWKCMVKYD